MSNVNIRDLFKEKQSLEAEIQRMLKQEYVSLEVDREGHRYETYCRKNGKTYLTPSVDVILHEATEDLSYPNDWTSIIYVHKSYPLTPVSDKQIELENVVRLLQDAKESFERYLDYVKVCSPNIRTLYGWFAREDVKDLVYKVEGYEKSSKNLYEEIMRDGEVGYSQRDTKELNTRKERVKELEEKVSMLTTMVGK